MSRVSTRPPMAVVGLAGVGAAGAACQWPGQHAEHSGGARARALPQQGRRSPAPPVACAVVLSFVGLLLGLLTSRISRGSPSCPRGERCLPLPLGLPPSGVYVARLFLALHLVSASAVLVFYSDFLLVDHDRSCKDAASNSECASFNGSVFSQRPTDKHKTNKAFWVLFVKCGG